MPISRDQLAAIMPRAAADGRLAVWYGPLVTEMRAHGITTVGRLAMFLANIAEETGELGAREENLNYSGARLREVFPGMFGHRPQLADLLAAQGPEAIANFIYADANRAPGYRLGNTQPGDGWRYRGRGPMQLTGRANYAQFFLALGLPPDSDPDIVLSPEIGAKSACHFWKAAGCNELADSGDFSAVVKRVNGGHINMHLREYYLARANAALGSGLDGGVQEPVEPGTPEDPEQPEDPDQPEEPEQPKDPVPDGPRSLCIGMEGDDVAALQAALNARSDALLEVNGVFEALTLIAVRRFQQESGLDADGIVGPITRTALGL